MASASAFGDVVEDDSTKSNSKGFKASSSGFVRRHALPSLGPATSAAKAAVAQRKKATMAQRKKDRKLGGSAGQTAAVPSKVAEKSRHKAMAQTGTKASDGAEGEAADGAEDKKQSGRYILFVGNLPYGATEDDIKGFFKGCGTPKEIRILTKKTSGKPKGCAFVDWESSEHQMRALLFHHRKLKDKRINVELTAGGGGSSSQRKKKLENQKKKRNKILRQKIKRMAATKEEGKAVAT